MGLTMPIYEFVPRDLGHPSWTASTHKERCRVHAPNEATARRLLELEFSISTDAPNPDGRISMSPWVNPFQAECIGQVEPEMLSYREGLIEVQGGPRAMFPTPFGVPPDPPFPTWMAINEDRRLQGNKLPTRRGWWRRSMPSSDGRTFENVSAQDDTDAIGVVPHSSATGNLEASGATVSSRDTVSDGPQITAQTVRLIARNRAVLTFQASSLLAFLDELIGPDGVPVRERNALRLADVLGVSDALAEGDLLDTLRQLRDELRRFNEALEHQKLEPHGLTEFRATALKSAAVAFGSTVGIGGGGVLITCIGGLLDSAHLMSWSHFIEFVKSVRG